MPYKDPPTTKITWPTAVVVLGLAAMLMTSVTILAVKGKDVNAVLSSIGGIIIVVGGLFGLSLHNKVDRVEQMTNGRLTDQIEENHKLQEQIAKLNHEKQSLALLIPAPSLDAESSPK